MKYRITKDQISFETDKWIYESPNSQTVYKRPLNKRGPKFLVLKFKYPGFPDACLN